MLTNLLPKPLWNNFSALNAIPRASKKETAIIQFMMDFGKTLNLPTFKDETGNVIIKKPATKGFEKKQTVCLQSHLDMVHQKNATTVFNFETEGIQMYIDDDWVKAKGTTLGADNGIGVAAIMALLSADSIPHPPLEALFTIDEETGMTGALGLKGSLLNAEILLNLDTEDDDELTIGCAGGIDVTALGKYTTDKNFTEDTAYQISVAGLTGGHSGMDIYKGRGNANKILNRILLEATQSFDFRIQMIDGGGLRNAIPREATAVIVISSDNINSLQKIIKDIESVLQEEFATTDPNLKITFNKVELPESVLNSSFQNKILKAVAACPDGIFRMSPQINGLVQTSNNLARVLVNNGEFTILCLTRSSVNTEKMYLAKTICYTFELADAQTQFGGSYPGWEPKPNSTIVKLMSSLYQEMFNKPANVNAVHAGLECGILGTNYPQMQMISFGPNIRGAHSPDEKVQISSVQKFWKFLLETLAHIPEKE